MDYLIMPEPSARARIECNQGIAPEGLPLAFAAVWIG